MESKIVKFLLAIIAVALLLNAYTFYRLPDALAKKSRLSVSADVRLDYDKPLTVQVEVEPSSAIEVTHSK
jgi:hypothetical protein